MTDLTRRYANGLDRARRERFPDPALVFVGRDSAPPRAPKDLLTIETGWNARYEDDQVRQKRFLTFFIADRDELTLALVKATNSIRTNGMRYKITDDFRAPLGEPRFWKIYCEPLGESV